MAGLLDLFARLFSPPEAHLKRDDDLDVENGALLREDPEQNELEFLTQFDEYWRRAVGSPQSNPESEADLYVNMMVVGNFMWLDSRNPITKALVKTYKHRGDPMPEGMYKSKRAGKCYIFSVAQVQEAVQWVHLLYVKHRRMQPSKEEG